ncbi:MAG TPA: type II toxin-antitoxin system HicB family antitoxin [Thermodesulfovibrionia bacterium]|nr:type II toxin-antitoxin system HicB family antitoxin [Thermodesulfovibrionia bacterium]
MNYTAVIFKEQNWYAGFLKEIPGANSQGKTIEEVIENLEEAAKLILESNIKHKFDEIKDKDYEEKIITI